MGFFFKSKIMHVSVKQSKNVSTFVVVVVVYDRRHTPQWPHFLLSDSTLTCFVVIKDTQLAIIWTEVSSSLCRGPTEQ